MQIKLETRGGKKCRNNCSLANGSEVTLDKLDESEGQSINCISEYFVSICVCVHACAWACTLRQVEGFQHTGGLLGLLGCSGSVATAGSPPSLPPSHPWSDLQPVQGGLPVSLPFSSTDESGRSQTNASGKWSVTGNGGREHRHGEGGVGWRVGGCRERDV